MIKNIIEDIEDECKEIPEQVLYRLLKLVGLITNSGEIENDYTKMLYISFAGYEFTIDSYYGNVYINDDDELEKEQVEKIIDEVKVRLYEYFDTNKKFIEKTKIDIFDRKSDLL